MKKKIKRSVTESMKKRIAGRQQYHCANSIENYECPFWKNNGNGCFDESGYNIDHIVELRNFGNNDESNLQALCINCHRVKTIRNKKPKKIISQIVPFDINNKNTQNNMRIARERRSRENIDVIMSDI